MQAHLAACVRLENVGVLLGAGASVDQLGGKTMFQLWRDFEQEHKASLNWLIDEEFVRPGEAPDVEKLSDDLEIAIAELIRQGRMRRVRRLQTVRADIQRAVIRASLLQQDWWERPEQVAEPNSPALGAHRQLLHRLVASRQPGQPSPWIFTTNYDLAIEWAAESIGLKVTNGFDGLHHRTFAPHNFDLAYRNAAARGEARFGPYNIYLAKLHGSLTWRNTRAGEYREIPSELAWISMKSFLESQDSAAFDSPMVFPSAAKYLSTVGFVLGELLRRCTDYLSRPHTLLITNGYSFSDEHLNRVLATALQNPTLQLVICASKVMRIGDHVDSTGCSRWIRTIVELESPQVTVVGGGSNAYLKALVSRLPEPVVFDEQAARIREALQRLRDAASQADSR